MCFLARVSRYEHKNVGCSGSPSRASPIFFLGIFPILFTQDLHRGFIHVDDRPALYILVEEAGEASKEVSILSQWVNR